MYDDRTPRQILESDELSRDEKIAALEKIAYDENALAVAQQEGMTLEAPRAAAGGLTAKEVLKMMGVQGISTDTMHGSV